MLNGGQRRRLIGRPERAFRHERARPIWPEMGERTLAYVKFNRAVCKVAWAAERSAAAPCWAASALSKSCLLTAFESISGRYRCNKADVDCTVAEDFSTAAAALRTAA